MKNKLSINKGLLTVFIISAILSSCVPARVLTECKASQERCLEENTKLADELNQMKLSYNETLEQYERLQKDHKGMVKDTAILGSAWRLEVLKNEQLNKTYELLLQKNKELLSTNQSETAKLQTELEKTQERLIKKEDVLNKMELELLSMKSELEKLEEQLKAKEQNLTIAAEELKQKEKRVYELQKVLTEKDSIVNALKNKVSAALYSFSDKGLSVEERNGKVYVSMENKLLFSSGSSKVGSEGEKALIELAKLLEQNKDINVLVEGHTDDVPYTGSGQIKDNWDLSVLRATAIVRILVDNSDIDPKRLTAAGRSKYIPVAEGTSAEARAKNRRTEIILTPKLDELFKIIETN
ncbi:MAG: OmpA family protein [Bacteroidales bacterium]|nr:OmpA family protein [Bacteroidales bacterium]